MTKKSMFKRVSDFTPRMPSRRVSVEQYGPPVDEGCATDRCGDGSSSSWEDTLGALPQEAKGDDDFDMADLVESSTSFRWAAESSSSLNYDRSEDMLVHYLEAKKKSKRVGFLNVHVREYDLCALDASNGKTSRPCLDWGYETLKPSTIDDYEARHTSPRRRLSERLGKDKLPIIPKNEMALLELMYPGDTSL